MHGTCLGQNVVKKCFGTICNTLIMFIFMSYDTYARTLKFVLFNFFRLSLKDIVYIGLRSIDPLEKLIMNKFNVHAYGMEVSSTKNKTRIYELNIR